MLRERPDFKTLLRQYHHVGKRKGSNIIDFPPLEYNNQEIIENTVEQYNNGRRQPGEPPDEVVFIHKGKRWKDALGNEFVHGEDGTYHRPGED